MGFSEEDCKVVTTAWKMGYEAAVYTLEEAVRKARCKKASQIIRERHPVVFAKEGDRQP